MSTHINWHAVIQPLPDHSLPLDVDVLSLFDWKGLDVFAVQEQGHRLGLHAEGNLVPVAVKQVVDSRILEHSSNSIFGHPNGVVLHRFVLTIQPDRYLKGKRSDVKQGRVK